MKVRKNKKRNKRGEITVDTTEYKELQYYGQLFTANWTTKTMNLLLESYILSRLNHKEIENLNRMITSKKIKKINLKRPQKQ